jgi:hypothetical protein
MRLIKILGLAAISAVVATALMGASSAMATFDTALCKEASANLACPAGQLTTEFHLAAKNTKVLTSVANFICAETLLKGTVLGLAKAPEPQVGHLTEFTFKECKTESGTTCNFHSVLLGLILILKTGQDVAKVEFDNTSLEYECGIYIDCAYGGEPILQALSASLPTHAGLLHANGVVLGEDPAHSDGICPSVAKWDALYEFLEDVYIRS